MVGFHIFFRFENLTVRFAWFPNQGQTAWHRWLSICKWGWTSPPKEVCPGWPWSGLPLCTQWSSKQKDRNDHQKEPLSNLVGYLDRDNAETIASEKLTFQGKPWKKKFPGWTNRNKATMRSFASFEIQESSKKMKCWKILGDPKIRIKTVANQSFVPLAIQHKHKLSDRKQWRLRIFLPNFFAYWFCHKVTFK